MIAILETGYNQALILMPEDVSSVAGALARSVPVTTDGYGEKRKLTPSTETTIPQIVFVHADAPEVVAATPAAVGMQTEQKEESPF